MFNRKEKQTAITASFVLWLLANQIVSGSPLAANESPTPTATPTASGEPPPVFSIPSFGGISEYAGRCYGLVVGGGSSNPSLVAWDKDNGVTLQSPVRTRVFVLKLPSAQDGFDLESNAIIIPKGANDNQRIEVFGARGYTAVEYQPVCNAAEIEDSVVRSLIPQESRGSSVAAADTGIFELVPEKNRLRIIRVARRDVDLNPLRVSRFINVSIKNPNTGLWEDNQPGYESKTK